MLELWPGFGLGSVMQTGPSFSRQSQPDIRVLKKEILEKRKAGCVGVRAKTSDLAYMLASCPLAVRLTSAFAMS